MAYGKLHKFEEENLLDLFSKFAFSHQRVVIVSLAASVVLVGVVVDVVVLVVTSTTSGYLWLFEMNNKQR